MRLPLLQPAELNAAQKALYDEMRSVISSRFTAFKSVDENDRLIGPFNASLHYPEVGSSSFALTVAVQAMGVIPPAPTEIAILVVAGYYKAAYEIYAHTAIAQTLRMPLDRISALVANIKPTDLASNEAATFDVAYALCRGGPLPDATWRSAVAAFGDKGAAQLIYLVGLYAYVSMSLNGFDVSAPEAA